MEDTPNAAAPQGTEVTPNTNSNDAPAETQAPAAPTANIPAEQIEAFNKFVDANGGFDKAFGKMKQTISNPQPQVEQPAPQIQLQQPQTAQAVQSETQPTTLAKPADGYISPNDIMAIQYNRLLKEAYPELDSAYMDKGEYLKEAAGMGIPVVDAQGNFNDKQIRRFLDLKKDTVPPTPASDPITNIPTVNYINVDGEIDTQEKAVQIMSQGSNHPDYQKAVDFLRNSIYTKNTPQKNVPQK